MPLRRRVLLCQAIVAACSALAAPAAARTRRTAHRHLRKVVRHPPRRRAQHARPLPVVVIDPGHGGKDPGCTGLGGTEEKTVVLELGRELRRQLHATRRCSVAMTRDTDVFVPLEQRVAFARRHHATVMISLHANASKDHHARGATVYRFSFRASDATARAMARWENSADRFGGPVFRHVSPAVTHILASLMRRETWWHAAWLQENLVGTMRHHIALTPVPARHARFVVLSAPDIPGVLIETGFLTNRVDERLLRSPEHRRLLALEIRRAVEKYLTRVAHKGRGFG